MPTLTIRSTVETSEVLARRELEDRLLAFYSYANLLQQVISVNFSSTVNLAAATTYMFAADPLATVVIGWIVNSVTTEIPLNQFTILSPPATPYLRNTATSGNPVPVKIIALS